MIVCYIYIYLYITQGYYIMRPGKTINTFQVRSNDKIFQDHKHNDKLFLLTIGIFTLTVRVI